MKRKSTIASTHWKMLSKLKNRLWLTYKKHTAKAWQTSSARKTTLCKSSEAKHLHIGVWQDAIDAVRYLSTTMKSTIIASNVDMIYVKRAPFYRLRFSNRKCILIITSVNFKLPKVILEDHTASGSATAAKTADNVRSITIQSRKTCNFIGVKSTTFRSAFLAASNSVQSIYHLFPMNNLLRSLYYMSEETVPYVFWISHNSNTNSNKLTQL